MYRKSKEPRALGNITEVILTSEKKKLRYIKVHTRKYFVLVVDGEESPAKRSSKTGNFQPRVKR